MERNSCELTAAGDIYPFLFEVYLNGKLLFCFDDEQHPTKKIRFTGNLGYGDFDAYVGIVIGMYKTLLLIKKKK